MFAVAPRVIGPKMFGESFGPRPHGTPGLVQGSHD